MNLKASGYPARRVCFILLTGERPVFFCFHLVELPGTIRRILNFCEFFMLGEQKKLGELAEMVQGELTGDPELPISGLADLAGAGPGEITFVADMKHQDCLKDCRAAAAIVPVSLTNGPLPLLRVQNPYLAAAIIHRFFTEEPFVAAGIDSRAVIGRDCLIPAEVSISPLVFIGDRVRIGKGVAIHPGVVVGDDVVIGDDTVLHANVTVGCRCLIGSRVIIYSGAVIGCDGFGYATDSEGRQIKRPHVGIVQIDDGVEIGANTCIDRATFGRTLIKCGVKVDNLVQLAHNVEIGENSLLVAQVGIAGSVSIGKNVVLGGQAGVVGHVRLEDRVMVAGKAGVHSDVQAGAVVSGVPAIPHKTWLRASAAYARLPEMARELRELKRLVAELAVRLEAAQSRDQEKN